jgi:hypothetical protein
VRSEIGDRLGLDVSDRRVWPPLQQRHPVIISAHMHPPLVAAEIEHHVVDARICRFARDPIARTAAIAQIDGRYIGPISAFVIQPTCRIHAWVPILRSRLCTW